MGHDFSVILKQKLRLLLLCRKYKREIDFLISISVGGSIEVIKNFLPGHTRLKVGLVDEYGYVTVGFLKKGAGEKLYLPYQERDYICVPCWYGFENAYGFGFDYIRGSYFSSVDGSNFPYSIRDDEEKFREIVKYLELFRTKVITNSDDGIREYISTFLEFFEDLDDYARDEMQCNVEDIVYRAKEIYDFYIENISFKNLLPSAKNFIREYIFLNHDVSSFSDDFIREKMGQVLPLFENLIADGEDEIFDGVFYSVLQIDTVGKLTEYFKNHPDDERIKSFLSCLNYFKKFTTVEIMDFAPFYYMGNDEKLYVHCFFGRDEYFGNLFNFDPMNANFIATLVEFRFLYEEIFEN